MNVCKVPAGLWGSELPPQTPPHSRSPVRDTDVTLGGVFLLLENNHLKLGISWLIWGPLEDPQWGWDLPGPGKQAQRTWPSLWPPCPQLWGLESISCSFWASVSLAIQLRGLGSDVFIFIITMTAGIYWALAASLPSAELSLRIIIQLPPPKVWFSILFYRWETWFQKG